MLLYYTPRDYTALEILTGVPCPHVKAKTTDGLLTICIIGFTQNPDKFCRGVSKIWSEDLENRYQECREALDEGMTAMLLFVRAAHNDMKENVGKWRRSLLESQEYLIKHRRVIIAVSRRLGYNFISHDVTKSKAVQLALGFLWHWPLEKTESQKEITKLATHLVLVAHLELERHHPEYKGEVYLPEVFTDRVAVHLVKDPRDQIGGWYLPIKFIPEKYRQDWFQFVQKNIHINLYGEVIDKMEF